MAHASILVVEDDTAIRQGVVDALEFEDYSVFQARDGVEGMRMGVEVECDLILLDLMLPGHDGLEILKEVRAVRPTLPVIILTARGQESDRVGGLRLGADDYVVKPFSVKELLARIEAVLRCSPERPDEVNTIELPDANIDLARCEVVRSDGSRHELSEKEVDLLRYLAENSGRVISRDEILSRVWRMNTCGVETRTIDMHIARLRDKIERDSSQPEILITVRGKGYKFARLPSDK